VQDLFAQHERARIRERTKAALSVIRSHGRKTGGDVPYCFTVAADGRTLVAVDGEQAIVRKARELRAMGVSLPKISAMLAAEGHVGRTGRPLHPMQVSRMTA
jgi:DNA invertase Pin-like site-specific DNA recombinase